MTSFAGASFPEPQCQPGSPRWTVPSPFFPASFANCFYKNPNRRLKADLVDITLSILSLEAERGYCNSSINAFLILAMPALCGEQASSSSRAGIQPWRIFRHPSRWMNSTPSALGTSSSRTRGQPSSSTLIPTRIPMVALTR